MSQNPKTFDLYDIVMFSSTVGPEEFYIGVVVRVGDEGYHVRFYNSKKKKFGVAFAVTSSEVEWIGEMPKGVVKDL